MVRLQLFTAAILSVSLGACVATPPAAEPSPPLPEPEVAEPNAEAEQEPTEPKEEEAPSESGSAKAEPPPEPKFTEDMSVEDAISAVPQGTPRLNMEDDLLSKPLTDPALYAPCKAGGNQHFKLRVAVWNGKAVGVDVTTKPNNPRLSDCIKKQVRGAAWEDKVLSLNTVEYSY